MNNIKKVFVGLAVLLLATLGVLFFVFKVSPISWGLLGPINENSGLAVKGYDPVAYFTEGEPTRGDTRKGIKWSNTIWYFSSDPTKLMFKTFPEKYAPQFGGYCAKAVASGLTADIDPQAWLVHDDKLYLFFNNDAKMEFMNEIENGIIDKATAEWAKR